MANTHRWQRVDGRNHGRPGLWGVLDEECTAHTDAHTEDKEESVQGICAALFGLLGCCIAAAAAVAIQEWYMPVGQACAAARPARRAGCGFWEEGRVLTRHGGDLVVDGLCVVYDKKSVSADAGGEMVSS